jgi:hypothetical protein
MERRRTAGGWYLVGIGLIGSALAIAITGFAQMGSTVEGMQRVAMPGRADVTIAGGRSSIYFEEHSVVADVAIDAPADLQPACTLEVAETHAPVALEPPRSPVTYHYGDYSGRSLHDFDPGLARSFTITCTGSTKYVLALGGGIGAWFIVAAIGGLVPGLAGLIVIAIVFFKRRAQARAAK